MQILELSLDVKTCTILLDGLSSANRVTEAFSLLRTMEEKDIIVDVVTYSSLIEKLCQHKT